VIGVKKNARKKTQRKDESSCGGEWPGGPSQAVAEVVSQVRFWGRGLELSC
jgi:hypothetical protein